MKSVGIVVIAMAVLLLISGAQATDKSIDAAERNITITDQPWSPYPETHYNISLEDYSVRHDSASLDSFIRWYMGVANIPGLATWAGKNGQDIWLQCLQKVQLLRNSLQNELVQYSSFS